MLRKLDPTQTGTAADRLRGDLERNVIGQPEAIQRVLEVYQTFLAGLSGQGRPLGNMLFLGATGTGKAQSLDARVLATDGWTTMGALKVGDMVRTPANTLVPVSGVFPQGDKQIYRITFVDGRSAECCNDHLWRVVNRRGWHGQFKVLSLSEIRHYMATHTKHNGLYIERPEALDMAGDAAALPMPAYEFGAQPWMGAGTVTEPHMAALGEMGLAALVDCPPAGRFIPDLYKNARISDRIDLVRGIMGQNKSFSTGSRRLAEDLQYVIRSLGGCANLTIEGEGDGDTYKVTRYDDTQLLRILSIEPTRVAAAQCISLQDDSPLYVTDDFVVTHNTKLVESVAQSLAGDPKALLKIDCGEFQHSHEIAKLIGCFVPGTKVLMADGDGKPIEDVKKGDMVLAGDGVPRPVLDTYIYQSSGEMIQIDIASNNIPLVATPDHKILAIRNPTEPGKRVRDPKSMYRADKLEWVPAKDLRKKDIVVYPRYKGDIIEPPVIDLADYADQLLHPIVEEEWVTPRGANATRIKRYIKVDENFARLAGYYVAEGGITRDANGSTGISFTLGVPHKQPAIDAIKSLIPEIFGVECSHTEEDRSEHNSVRLYLHSHFVAPFIEDLFGGHTLTKHVPDFFIKLPANLLWNFIDAAIMGDGCRTEPRRVDYSTSSSRLHHQFNTILRARLGITTQVQWHKATKAGWQDRYRTYIAGAQIENFAKCLPKGGAGIDLRGARYAEGIQRGSHVDNEYVYFQLADVKRIAYKGPVHDIAVSKEAQRQRYTTESAVVSNSPPGYLGHRETHPLLSQEALNQYHTDNMKISFLLFDEIEKASNALWHLLLGILDKATLTLGDNRRVDFSRAIIFMTSNLGAAEMNRVINPGLGFAVPSDIKAEATIEKLARTGTDSARRNFTPEFMNRLDAVVVFRNLGAPEIDRIFDLEIAAIQNRIFKQCNNAPFVVRVSAGARQLLLQQSFDVRYGARHLKRTIERMLVTPLSNLISSGQVHGGDLIEVDVEEGAAALLFHCLDENMTALAMLKEMNQLADGATMGEDGGSGGGTGDCPPRKMAEPRRNVIPYVKRPPTRVSRQRTAGPAKPPPQNKKPQSD